MLRRRAYSAKPLTNLCRRCRISKLRRQIRKARGIYGFRGPDSQLLFFSVRCHCFAFAFRRSLLWTAWLWSSRSASAAIHRADREP